MYTLVCKLIYVVVCHSHQIVPVWWGEWALFLEPPDRKVSGSSPAAVVLIPEKSVCVFLIASRGYGRRGCERGCCKTYIVVVWHRSIAGEASFRIWNSYFLGDMSNSENVTQPESQPAQTNQYRSKIDTTYLRSIEGIIRLATLVSILLRKQGSDFPMSSFLSAKLPPLFLCIYIHVTSGYPCICML